MPATIPNDACDHEGVGRMSNPRKATGKPTMPKEVAQANGCAGCPRSSFLSTMLLPAASIVPPKTRQSHTIMFPPDSYSYEVFGAIFIALPGVCGIGSANEWRR